MGDLNIDYMKLDNVCAIWKDMIRAFNLEQMVKVPTRITSTSQTLIDHVYTNRPEYVQSIDVPFKSASDHFPLDVTWWKTTVSKTSSHNYIQYRSNRQYNKFAFLEDLNEDVSKICIENDIDDTVASVKNAIIQNINKHAPVISKRVKHHKQPMWFSKDVKQAIQERDRQKKCGNHQKYVTCRNHVVSLIRKSKGNYYKEALEKCQGNSSKLWKYMRDLKGCKRDKTINVIEYENELFMEPKAIAMF